MRLDSETETFLPIQGGSFNEVAHALRADGFDASEDGTGRGTPIIPIDMRQASRGATMTNNRSDGSSGGAPGTGIGEDGDPSPTISTSHPPAVAIAFAHQQGGSIDLHMAQDVALTHQRTSTQAVAFDTTQITSKANRSNPKPDGPCHPLSAGAHPPAIAIQERAICENPDAGPDGAGIRDDGAAYTLESRTVPQAVAFQSTESGVYLNDTHATLDANNGSRRMNGVIAPSMAVRRLTPRECERLQGFRDDYTLIGVKQSRDIEADYYRYLRRTYPTITATEAKRLAKDGPRYKALGNSMAIPPMRWIGQRIQIVDALEAA